MKIGVSLVLISLADNANEGKWGLPKNWAEYFPVYMYNYIYRHKCFRFMRNVMHEVHMSEWVLIHFKITINLKFSIRMN